MFFRLSAPIGTFATSVALISAAPNSLDSVLQRAGDYVHQYERSFSTVVSDEHYEQQVFQRGSRFATTLSRPYERSGVRRKLFSEVFFAWIPEDAAWVTVRNVLKVDDRTIGNSHERIERAMSEDPERRSARLRILRDEGARFNIGSVFRDLNDPSLAIQFLDRVYQPRFDFSLVRTENVKGILQQKVAFQEKQSPTVVRNDATGADLFSRGAMWIEEKSGAITRTQMTVQVGESTEEVTVDYEANARLGVWVPARMKEEYVSDNGRIEERVSCAATYSNFRRFETSAKLVK